MSDTKGWARRVADGLSSLRDRAAARLAALRFNPSRWLAFAALALLTLAYGGLLIGYTIAIVVMDHSRHGAWWALYTLAIQFALLWAFFSLALFAKAVRPY